MGQREILLNINIKREELKGLIEQETRIALNLAKKEKYIWGNKTGKYLANMVKKKRIANYIEKYKQIREK